jgi:hypothetical protein
MSTMSNDVVCFIEKKPLRDAPQHRQGLVLKSKPSNHVKTHIYYHSPASPRCPLGIFDISITANR